MPCTYSTLAISLHVPCARACACRSPYWRILPRRPELELDAELAAILVTHVHQEYRAGPRPLWQRLLAGVVVELADLLLPTRAEYEARRLGGLTPPQRRGWQEQDGGGGSPPRRRASYSARVGSRRSASSTTTPASSRCHSGRGPARYSWCTCVTSMAASSGSSSSSGLRGKTSPVR